MMDPVELTRKLVRCPSVTPEDAGALDLLRDALSSAGFECVRVDRGGVGNLFARWGAKGAPRTFGFNGHTDVVPVGDRDAWTVDPFGGEILDGWLYGRGATDMKSGVAAFVAAACDFVARTPPDGAVILTVTGDEEGQAEHGTTAILDFMNEAGERMDACVVGEPTSSAELGDMCKIGRRGSMTVSFTATGRQGHSAYPHRALNPLPALARLMDRLSSRDLDAGTEHFDASTLAITTIDTGNPAGNVIPAVGRAAINIRFNDSHSSNSLSAWIADEVARVGAETGVGMETLTRVSGESFLTPPGYLSELVARAVEAETGRRPEASTTGGTSDARFVKNHCPVVEFGLVGHRMHAVDERVAVGEIGVLKSIYGRMLKEYFKA